MFPVYCACNFNEVVFWCIVSWLGLNSVTGLELTDQLDPSLELVGDLRVCCKANSIEVFSKPGLLAEVHKATT